MIPAILLVLGGVALTVWRWVMRRRVAKAEQRAEDAEADREEAERAAEVATMTVKVNAEADRRETAAHIEADAAIPVPASDGWEAVGEIDRARAKHDAARRVRAKLAKAKP